MKTTDRALEDRLQHWAQGWDAARAYYAPQITRLQYTADRLYTEMCRRTPPKPVERPSFAQLQRIRDDIYEGRK